jgi:hypothetical protein
MLSYWCVIVSAFHPFRWPFKGNLEGQEVASAVYSHTFLCLNYKSF